MCLEMILHQGRITWGRLGEKPIEEKPQGNIEDMEGKDCFFVGGGWWDGTNEGGCDNDQQQQGYEPHPCQGHDDRA